MPCCVAEKMHEASCGAAIRWDGRRRMDAAIITITEPWEQGRVNLLTINNSINRACKVNSLKHRVDNRYTYQRRLDTVRNPYPIDTGWSTTTTGEMDLFTEQTRFLLQKSSVCASGISTTDFYNSSRIR